MEAPLVVFLDSHSWQTFLDVAGALRARGVRVRRVTARSLPARTAVLHGIESLVFGRSRRIVDGGLLAGRPASVSVAELLAAVPPEALDVQCQDDLLACTLPVASGPCAPSRRVAIGVDPAVLVDKRVQADYAGRAGVPVPRTWEEPVADRFPVVVKDSVGFGGFGVLVAQDPDELAHAWAALMGEDGRAPFLQEHMRPSVHTGGVAQHGELVACVAYDGAAHPGDPTGPPTLITAVDDVEAVELTRRFVEVIGYTGFFCIDWVASDEGGLHLIDFNARLFGSAPALQELGFDLIGAYLHVLGAGPRPSSVTGVFDRPAVALRYPCPDPSTSAAVRSWRRETLQVVRARRSWEGRRWATAIRLRTELGAGVALLALAAGRARVGKA